MDSSMPNDGAIYSYTDVQPKCVRSPHVPLWVGGSSKSALRRVAEFGDVWHPMGFTVISDVSDLLTLEFSPVA